jgi:hypothetical protein
MLKQLNRIIGASLSGHHSDARAEIFPVTSDIRENAGEHHISPAKYLAISELQELDPTVTFEECAGHSIGAIRERARIHGGNHHNELDSVQGAVTGSDPSEAVNHESEKHHVESEIRRGEPEERHDEHEIRRGEPEIHHIAPDERHDEPEEHHVEPEHGRQQPNNANNSQSGNAHHTEQEKHQHQ